MQWPSGRRDSIGFLPYGPRSNPAQFRDVGAAGSRVAQATGGFVGRATSYPDGYGRNAWIMPIKAGQRAARIGNEASGVGIATGALGVSEDGLSVSVSFGVATGQAVFPGFANGASSGSGVAVVIGIADGSAVSVAFGSGAVSGQAIISAEAIGGASSQGSIVSNAIAWGMASNTMEGLTPNSVANAVWSALAAANNEPGTMGDLLNAAGGGGISGAVIDQIVDAVWERTGSNGAQYGATLTSADKWAKLSAALSA